MPRETMTPRERWLAVLRRETPDRVPMDYWATGEASAKLMQHLGCSDMDEVHRRLHIDTTVGIAPRYIGPPTPPGQDAFGIEYRSIDYGTGSYNEAATHPLARFTSVDEIEREYTWPSPDWFDVSHAAETVAKHPDRPIGGGGSEPFLRYAYLRGLERAMMDLVEHPDIAHYCLGKLFDLAYETSLRTFEAAPGQITSTYVAEDMGAQDRMMFSPAQVREFLLPGMKRMIDLAHEAGVFVFHHNDGAVRPIIPTMIEAGIDVLNPVQWRCKGMEREGLKRDFGDRVVFHGGVDNQQTLVFGTPDDVRQEVADNYRILGEAGGYILAPCHNIQAVSPPENVVAMYEAGYDLGWR